MRRWNRPTPNVASAEADGADRRDWAVAEVDEVARDERQSGASADHHVHGRLGVRADAPLEQAQLSAARHGAASA